MERAIVNPARPRRQKRAGWVWRGILLGLLIWILADVFIPRKHSIRQFDPAEVARLETNMWRSYYDKNPALLFWQLAGGLRQQFHAPFWRSFGLAFQATEAAFVFKRGQSRTDYQQAMPTLVSYYTAIQALTEEQFDVNNVARFELEWWIVHRQRDRYSYQDLANALAQTSSALYTQPASNFAQYAKLRAEAMRRCDEAGQQPGGATEANWQRIDEELNRAWTNLHTIVGVN